MHRYLLVLLFTLSSLAGGELSLSSDSDMERAFLESWNGKESPGTDIIGAWLIAEGISDSGRIEDFRKEYRSLLANVKSEIDTTDDVDDMAEDIFDFLHDDVLKEPYENAPFHKIISSGVYNSLTGGALYYLICHDLNLPVTLYISRLFVTVHVQHGKEEIIVMIIEEDGFDYDMTQIEDVSELFTGLEHILAHTAIEDITTEKMISAQQLAAAFYNNRGIFMNRLQNAQKAIHFFEKAIYVDANISIYRENYRATLYLLCDQATNFDPFIPYMRNAFYLLKTDAEFRSLAIYLVEKTMFFYVEEKRNFPRAVELLNEFKTSYTDQDFCAVLPSSSGRFLIIGQHTMRLAEPTDMLTN